MTTWNPRACHVLYLHLMKWMLTEEMNGGQVQRSGAHTALSTLKYLRTCKRENNVTCVTTRYKTWNKKGLCEQVKTNGFFWETPIISPPQGEKKKRQVESKKQTNKYIQTNGQKDRQMARQTDRQTGRQTDRQTNRQRQTDRQTDRKTNRQTEILVRIQLTVRQT